MGFITACFSERDGVAEADLELVQGRPFLSGLNNHRWVCIPEEVKISLSLEGSNRAASRADHMTSKLPSGSEFLDSMKKFPSHLQYCGLRS